MTISEWLAISAPFVVIHLIASGIWIWFQNREIGRLHKQNCDLLNQNVRLQNELRGKRKEVHRLKRVLN